MSRSLPQQRRDEPPPQPVPYRAINGHTLMPHSGHWRADGTWQWHYWNATHDDSCRCRTRGEDW